MAELGLWAALARRTGTRFVVTHHGDLHLPDGAMNRIIERLTFAGWRYAARRADALVAYSDDYATHSEWLAPWPDRIVVVAPPIAIPEPDPAAVAVLRRELAPEGGPLVVFAGRFAREKRPDLLLDAIAPLRARHQHLRVVFAGEERLGYEDTRTAFEPRVAAAKDAVRFLGLVDDAQTLANVYAACDVLALPSQTECFGLVQVEAMLCGTPVVASDLPGARVPVQATGAGRLFESGSVDGLVDAIDDVAHRDAYRPDPARVARAFDLARTVDAYRAFWAGSDGRPRPTLDTLLAGRRIRSSRGAFEPCSRGCRPTATRRYVDVGCGRGYYCITTRRSVTRASSASSATRGSPR
jgi:glycosyltransferase involved in cell wall biosynthesis